MVLIGIILHWCSDYAYFTPTPLLTTIHSTTTTPTPIPPGSRPTEARNGAGDQGSRGGGCDGGGHQGQEHQEHPLNSLLPQVVIYDEFEGEYDECRGEGYVEEGYQVTGDTSLLSPPHQTPALLHFSL